ncbi:hypothetical protein BDN72DRAFT_831194 [Pluteus cervinus]|uniref:Uncharacterized protein n=1 Tax=Pluteus cervinus TaxID=181527 RepID=A0ACD3BD39_9AGAR|nr:hypothetical protein BDN72DRAFT_831194 [Pluteus cervinus]
MEVLSSSSSLPSAWPLERTFPPLRNPNDQFFMHPEYLDDQCPSKSSQPRPSRRLTVSTFLPLPSITASPLCTPTPSISSDVPAPAPLQDRPMRSVQAHPPPPPDISIPSIDVPPRWISTPPTPPPKLFRRSATFSTRQVNISVPPSTSFPTIATSQIGDNGGIVPLRRCFSDPLMRSILITNPKDMFVTEPESLSEESQASSSQPSSSFDVAPLDHSSPSVKRSKPIFHLPNLTDDEIMRPLSESPQDESIELGCDSPVPEKYKDDIRKYHALMELLSTEAGYLDDLRALVTIYLRGLPGLSYRAPSIAFGRASSFSSTSWNNHSTATLSHPSTAGDNSNFLTTPSKDSTKTPLRFVFTIADIAAVTRNAEEILELHEQFVRELQAAMQSLGFSHESYTSAEDELPEGRLGNLEEAIRTVATKFATEASRFNAYQTFCTGHPEAVRLIKRVHQQHPLEWDAFEQRCASAVQDLCDPPTSAEPQVLLQHSQSCEPRMLSAKDRIRTSSLNSLDGAVRSLRSRVGAGSTSSSPLDTKKERLGSRLALLDYLIKPVQRICKYPLLLDQLKPKKSFQLARSSVDVIVESAAQAMRHVAASVDEARRQQDVAIQSSLIISRMAFTHPTPISPGGASIDVLTPSFLISLGTCLLAGSLDVMHCHTFNSAFDVEIGTSVRSKYLGAFLYAGGYLIIVKVAKARIYEPKHWFSLVGFDVTDVEEDVLLPCSFQLSSGEHRFELTASCRREKTLWLDSIREALRQTPTWVNEPMSSIMRDAKGDLLPTPLDDEPFENMATLPTIQSIPEMTATSSQPDLTDSVLMSSSTNTTKRNRRLNRSDTGKREVPSRRSSTASVKAIFAPAGTSDAETIMIRRCSASTRSQVDQGLHDVLSHACLHARSAVMFRDEDVAPGAKPQLRTNFTRSSSAMSVAGMAKNRLSRHESVRVPRRKSMVDNSLDRALKLEQVKAKTVRSRRRADKLSISTEGEAGFHHRTTVDSVFTLSPFLRCPSTANSSQDSSGSTPNTSTSYLHTPPLEQINEPLSPFKRRRSLVKNVRSLFNSLENTPIMTPINLNPETPAKPKSSGKQPSTSIFRRFGISSLHRRSRSAPEVPNLPMPGTRDQVSAAVVVELHPTKLGDHDNSPLSPPSLPTTPQKSKRRTFLPAPMFSSEKDLTQSKTQSSLFRLKA